MGILKLASLTLVLFFSHTSSADIFGMDDRTQAVRQNHLKQERQSVAVGVLSTMIEPEKNGFHEIMTDPSADFLCQDERFSEQNYISYACTGFLVGPDLLVTAGHCGTNEASEITDEEELYCQSYSWVFDYFKNESSQPYMANKDSVYKCKKIIYAVFDGNPNTRDFTLIQLDRPVVNKKPLKLSQEELKVGNNIFMLGHPLGLPMKYSGWAKVTYQETNDPSFMTDLDAFAGNSGSPVFNSKKEVVGVLVGGSPNATTYEDVTKQCERFNHCDENGQNCVRTDSVSIPQNLPEAFSEVQKIKNYWSLIQSHLNTPFKPQTTNESVQEKKEDN